MTNRNGRERFRDVAEVVVSFVTYFVDFFFVVAGVEAVLVLVLVDVIVVVAVAAKFEKEEERNLNPGHGCQLEGGCHCRCCRSCKATLPELEAVNASARLVDTNNPAITITTNSDLWNECIPLMVAMQKKSLMDERAEHTYCDRMTSS